MVVLCTIEFDIQKNLRSAHIVYLCVVYGSQSRQWLFPYTLADGLRSRQSVYWGTAVAQWLRCCATNRKVAGSIPAGVIGIFH